MTVTAVRKDTEKLTLTLDAEFDAPAERIWQLWADPRQLERWWGPPTWPATVVDHAPGVEGCRVSGASAGSAWGRPAAEREHETSDARIDGNAASIPSLARRVSKERITRVLLVRGAAS